MTKMFAKIKAVLDEQGRYQEDLAYALGVRPKRISIWMSQEDPKLSPREFLEIARYLGVTLEWLVDDSNVGLPMDGPTQEEQAILKLTTQFRLTSDDLMGILGEVIKAHSADAQAQDKPDARPAQPKQLTEPVNPAIRADGRKVGPAEAHPPETPPRSPKPAKERKSRPSES